MGGLKKLRQKLPDPLDVWGGKAEQERKDRLEREKLDRKAIEEAKGVAAETPTMASDEVAAAREAERRRRAGGGGQGGTILTGASGLAGGAGSGKTLLGQ